MKKQKKPLIVLSKGVKGLAVMVGMSLALGVQAQTTIGLGTGILPKYEGSKKYTSRFFPLVSHQSGNLFIAPKAEMPAIGLQTDLTDAWKVGVFTAYQWGRKASDDPHIYGTDRIKNHANIGVFSQYSINKLVMDVTLYQALKKDYGLGLQLGLAYPIWQEGLSRAAIGGNLSFMNTEAMQTHFGVKQHEAVASAGRLSQHDASGGLKSATIYGAYTYQLTEAIHLNTALGLKTLTGDARKSSITEHKTSVYGSVALGYSF